MPRPRSEEQPTAALFPRLAHGRSAPPPARVARHQRARLQGAMVAAVARHGYAATTISELVALAGVSKSAFYRHFDSKEECFLSTFELIVEEAARRVERAYRAREGLRDRVGAALRTLAEMLETEPDAASLVIVNSLELGRAALRPREQVTSRFVRMLEKSFAAAPEGGEVSAVEVRAIVAGIRRVMFRCLREGEPGRLATQVDDLVEWALSYRRPADQHAAPATTKRARRRRAGTTTAPGEGTGSQGADGRPEPDWREPPNSAASRRLLSQRERIVRATARVTAERGYAALSIPAITAAAGVSNQTFYACFPGKQEAFEAAFDALAARALQFAAAAYQAEGEWRRGIAAAVEALLSFVAAEPLFARFTFIELPAAGLAGPFRADAVMRRFTALLEPPALPAGMEPLPEVIVDAIGGGIWGVIRFEIAAGRERSLPRLAPQLADVALVPFGVAAPAAV